MESDLAVDILLSGTKEKSRISIFIVDEDWATTGKIKSYKRE